MSAAPLELERALMRAHCRHLVERGGRGWHAYTLAKAEGLQAEDPQLHAGLVEHVETCIGPTATAAARREIAYFNAPKRRRA